MIYLLDVSLFIALLDEDHVHHKVAFSWFDAVGARGWATCPITENGLLRILTSSSYPRNLGPSAWVFEIFRELCARKGHHFWPDDLTLLDGTSLVTTAFPSVHITDIYLLALAIKHRGKLATFDRRIPADLVADGSNGLNVVSHR